MNLDYEPHHKCGIFGVYNYNLINDTINSCINGLKLLQHRGRESAGIAYYKANDTYNCFNMYNMNNMNNIFNRRIITYKKPGTVNHVFANYFEENNVNACIGHVRYSTTKIKGNSSLDAESDLLPMTAHTIFGDFSIAHNGNIPNIDKWKCKFNLKTNNDTEILVQYVLENIVSFGWEKTLRNLLYEIPGVYCLLVLTPEGIYFFKDQYGYHPLCVGYNKEDDNDIYYIASESCSFDKKYYLGEVMPGKINFIGKKSENKLYLGDIKKHRKISFCLFEYIYFMNNKSIGPIQGEEIEKFRYKCGQYLASTEENLFEKSDFIAVDVPKTSTQAAIAFAKRLGIQYENLLCKTKNCGRSFILPTNEERIKFIQNNVYIKDSAKLHNKKIFLLDDSIVRGNTMKQIIKILKDYGVIEIHLRIISPPIVGSCYFGIDIPSTNELIAHKKTVEEVCIELGADTLKYLTVEDMNNIVDMSHFCTACFGGEYNKEVLELNW